MKVGRRWWYGEVEPFSD